MKFPILSSAAAAALLFAAATTAQATPTLAFSIDNGATFTTCADGDACDTQAAAGIVGFNSGLGVFSVNVTVGVGDIGSPTSLMDLNSINLNTSGGSGSLIVKFSDIGYTHIGAIAGTWGGTISGAGTVAGAAYAGASNTLFQESSLLGGLGPFSSGLVAGSFTGLSPAVGPYSLTQILTITTTGATSYSGDFELKVPEPGSLALAGLALLAAGAIRRRTK